MTCIEPYPNPKLRELVSEHHLRLRENEVQDIDLAVFQALTMNDVLFIDSSHVSKKDSDVDFLYLEVLPRLQKGVVIHIHDMPFPMPAIPRQHPLFETFLFWNEVALVKAFLTFNTSFRVIMCQSCFHWNHRAVLKKLVPVYDPGLHFPCSLWLRKVS
jgi:SAM-dependent methyltransferase